MGTSTAFSSSQGIVLVARVYVVAYLEQGAPLFFIYDFLNAKNQENLLPTSYVRGPNFNGSSTKHRVPLLRNWLSQRYCYDEV